MRSHEMGAELPRTASREDASSRPDGKPARPDRCAPECRIANKNWAEADTIRDELLAQGIQLKDGKDPVSGERVTTWEVKR